MNRWDCNNSNDEEIWFSFAGISTVWEYCICWDRTRITNITMEIFNSCSVGPEATILSRIPLLTVLCLGYAGPLWDVNVRPKLSKCLCRQFCPNVIRTQLLIIFPRIWLESQGQISFTSANELDHLRCEISSFADFRRANLKCTKFSYKKH